MNEPSFAGLEMQLNAVYAAEPRDGFVQGLEKQLLSPRKARTHFWQWWGRDLRQSSQVRLAWTAVVVLVLAACIFATPQGRAWAQNVVRSFLGYFSVTDKNSLPLPETPRPLPTYSIEPALLPFEPKTTPAADPAQCGATLTLLTATPRCQMLNVQAESGFDVHVFGATDLPIQINGAFYFNDAVHINYVSDDGVESYRLSQGLGDFPLDYSPWGQVQAGAVRQVVVGNHPGELVLGQFVSYVGKTTLDWLPSLPNVELRWREGDRWYSIVGDRYYWNGDQSQVDEFVQTVMALGQNLVPLSTGAKGMAGNVEQTPHERVGFRILTPTSLPADFTLEGVRFGSQFEHLDRTIVITYALVKNGQWTGGITLSEASASNRAVDFMLFFTGVVPGLKYDLIQDETIQIGRARGRYVVRRENPYPSDSGSTALIWEQSGVKIMLQPTYADWMFGGRFTKAELIAIAESLK